MSKPAIAIIIIIIAVGAICCFYQTRKVPEEPKEEVLVLLEELKQQSGIRFSEIEPAQFKWVVKVDPEIEEQDISGKGFEAKRITIGQERRIGEFLKKEGFEEDPFNTADGTISGLRGYRKNQIVCVVTSGAAGYKEATGQWIPSDPNKRDAEVKCGKGSGLTKYLMSTEKAIRKLLAEKYGKKMAEVTINISQEEGKHIKGGVEFQPGGPENSGMFLAVKEGGHWKLVHDGQGAISCSAIEPYNFPVDMVAECFDQDTGKIENKVEEACINSGGRITISLCCKSSGNYPNLCLIGACGCSLDNSHEINICDCGEGKCFNGTGCIIF